MVTDDLGSYVNLDVVKVNDGKKGEETQPVATEVPCTVVVKAMEEDKVFKAEAKEMIGGILELITEETE